MKKTIIGSLGIIFGILIAIWPFIFKEAYLTYGEVAWGILTIIMGTLTSLIKEQEGRRLRSNTTK